MKKTTIEVKPKTVDAKPAPRIRTDWKAAYNQSVADAKRWRDAAESLSVKLAKERAELVKERNEGYRLVMAEITKMSAWDRAKMIWFGPSK